MGLVVEVWREVGLVGRYVVPGKDAVYLGVDDRCDAEGAGFDAGRFVGILFCGVVGAWFWVGGEVFLGFWVTGGFCFRFLYKGDKYTKLNNMLRVMVLQECVNSFKFLIQMKDDFESFL